MDSTCPCLNADDADAIARAAAVLRRGGLVAMPTETVYGLAANALDPTAVAKIFAAKERPAFDPLIVHVNDFKQAETLAVFNDAARALAEHFWPGPLTLVLPRKAIVPDLVTSGLDTVALRLPDHAAARALIAAADRPLAAPSANRFGSISPTTAAHVQSELGQRIDLILDGGTCTRGIESTVVSLRDGSVTVLRLGATSVEAISQAVGSSISIAQPSSAPGLDKQTPAPISPGMTQRHYAPRTPMTLVTSLSEHDVINQQATRIGLIGMGDLPEAGFERIENLSPKGDDLQAAANLFASLRALDDAKLDRIIAFALPDQGLGRAINDRLRRGSEQ